jgi:hypothetical protein
MEKSQKSQKPNDKKIPSCNSENYKLLSAMSIQKFLPANQSALTFLSNKNSLMPKIVPLWLAGHTKQPTNPTDKIGS